jgi:dihydroorotase
VSTWILNASVALPGGQRQTRHLRIENGQIAQWFEGEEVPEAARAAQADPSAVVIDAAGRLLAPGFVDMHVHLREPGYEYKEDIASGTASAAKGGFTTVACMPNTRPVADSPETIRYIRDRAKAVGVVKVLPYAAITRGQAGGELTDFAALKEAGAIGFSDDGFGVRSSAMMKRAMEQAAALGLPIVAHCEDDSLIEEGAAVTAGEFARRHGLRGIPNESEAIHVARDILLAEATGVHYHVCHVSTEQSVRLLRLAKSLGLRVTAEVCPHHLTLSDEDIPDLDANWKMNPPLRSPRDVEACIAALEDGTIDMIATDHAPHSAEEKARGLERAPFGIHGFETAFPLLYTTFVKSGRWTLDFLLRKMTADPARAFGLPVGTLDVGAPADLTLIDLEREQTVDPATFLSKGRNTPYAGRKLFGWPTLTMVDGRVVWTEKHGVLPR